MEGVWIMMLPLHLILEHSDGHCLFLVHFYYFYQTVNGDGKKNLSFLLCDKYVSFDYLLQRSK